MSGVSCVDPRTLKAGQRVRVTIEGTVKTVSGERWSVQFSKGYDAVELFYNAEPIVVELLPDPLPTVPGTRFWGATLSTEAQWWFVQAYGSGGLICYAAADGRQLAGDGVQSSYLRVVPEPKEGCDA
jgi:hypothetical protein